ncbi:uncharacterized protein LOC144447097 [Glandiceps talaboti]
MTLGGAHRQDGMVVTPDVEKVSRGEMLATADDLLYRNPNDFIAGEVHKHVAFWDELTKPIVDRQEIMDWIKNKISISKYFTNFKGDFKGERYNHDTPLQKVFTNNPGCQKYGQFIARTIADRIESGAVSVWGIVGRDPSPHIVMPITVEPTKPRMCIDMRYVNLWTTSCPFKLDKLIEVSRYLDKSDYHFKCDDKSGYDHVLIEPKDRTYVGFQWAGVWYVNNTLPFGWKLSAYIYHTLGYCVTSYARSLGVPCIQYIDDRHGGGLKPGKETEWDSCQRAQAAAYILCKIAIQAGYFIALEKSVLRPVQSLVMLGLSVDSKTQSFAIPEEKKRKFLDLIDGILTVRAVLLSVVQKLMGKCISFILALPCARLYIRQMAIACGKSQKYGRSLIPIRGHLRQEIEQWKVILKTAGTFTWPVEGHRGLRVYTDSSQYKWGAVAQVDNKQIVVSDMWEEEKTDMPIVRKEAEAIFRALVAFKERISNGRVDALVDALPVVQAWNGGVPGSKACDLNEILKKLFNFCFSHNVRLTMTHVASSENEADSPSRDTSLSNAMLTSDAWQWLDNKFGPHHVDAMANCSNKQLPRYISQFGQVDCEGVNFFQHSFDKAERIYVYPPFVMVPATVKHIINQRQNATVIVPRGRFLQSYWPLVNQVARDVIKVASKGEMGIIQAPSRKGYVDCPLPCDLYVINFEWVVRKS